MRGCDHDRVYSGQINLNQRFAWICMKCGEQSWSEDYVITQVNLELYHQLRVAHGWAAPPRLPAPPRVPTNTDPPKPDGVLAAGALFFMALAALCALGAIPWGALGPVLPPWIALIASGVALWTATICYVFWKRGSNG